MIGSKYEIKALDYVCYCTAFVVDAVEDHTLDQYGPLVVTTGFMETYCLSLQQLFRFGH